MSNIGIGETPKEMNKEEIKAFAVDADIVIYRCAAVCEGSQLSVLYNTVDEFIFNIARETGIHDMAMFLSPSTNFRYKVATTKPYKGNRDKIVRPSGLKDAKQYVIDRWGGYIKENYEADDCIASFMTQHPNVAHAGIDKDIRQIQGWHYNFVKRIWEFTTAEESILKMYRQICMGDTSDNIPGLPKIGEKKAAKLITDPYTAKEETLKLYKKIMYMMSDQEVLEYFAEQAALVTMVDTLDIPLETIVTVDPPKIFQPAEGAFMGIPETPKLSVFKELNEA